jgi:iron complex outermembrane receptor protein
MPGSDEWHGSHGGFRSDWDPSPQDYLTVQGDFFGTSEAQPITTLVSSDLPDLHTFNHKAKSAADNILTRWNHTFSDGSEAAMQLYYDRNRRTDQGTMASLNTGDFDFQYHFHPSARNDLVAGAGYRRLDLDFTSGYSLGYNVNHRTQNLLSLFAQDEIRNQ